jgi:mono/diheme cytochrome c family protein
MKAWIILVIGLTAGASSGAPIFAADLGRGRALYEVRCVECHSESVHQRGGRVARTYEDIRTWVSRWNVELGGAWGAEEIEDVTAYLNERFYSYSCTNIHC